MKTKVASSSLTIQALITLALVQVAALFDVVLDEGSANTIAMHILGLFGVAAGIYGRWRADKPLRLRKQEG